MPKIYIFDVASGVYGLVGLLLLLNSEKRILLPKYFIFMMLFTGIAFISLLLKAELLSTQQFANSGFYLVRLVIYYLVSFITFNIFGDDMTYRDRIIKIMLTSAAFVCLAGFIQLFLIPDFRVLPVEQGWDPHINRLASTFFDPNFAGGYIVLGLVLVFSMLSEIKDAKAKVQVLGLASLFITSLIATFSRSSWLMFSFVVLLFGIFKTRKLLIVTLLLMFLTYYLVPRAQTRLSGVTDPSDSAALRITSWKNAMNIAQDNAFTGVGFNAYRYAQYEYGFFDYKDESGGNAGSGADSSLLLVLATTGIPGLVIFSLQYVVLVWHGVAGWLKNKNSYMSSALVISIVAILVHSQFVNSIFYPQFLLWMSILYALSFLELDLNR